MRYIEIMGGIRAPVFGEEREILAKMKEAGGCLFKKDLDEREEHVASMMVSRGIINRRRKDGEIVFVTAQDDIRRI